MNHRDRKKMNKSTSFKNSNSSGSTLLYDHHHSKIFHIFQRVFVCVCMCACVFHLFLTSIFFYFSIFMSVHMGVIWFIFFLFLHINWTPFNVHIFIDIFFDGLVDLYIYVFFNMKKTAIRVYGNHKFFFLYMEIAFPLWISHWIKSKSKYWFWWWWWWWSIRINRSII